MVELGAGAGRNFGHHPPGVTEVTAVEPEPRLRRIAVSALPVQAVPLIGVWTAPHVLGLAYRM